MATHHYRLWFFIVAALLAAAPAMAQTPSGSSPDGSKQAATEKPAASKVADPSASGNSSARGDSSSADSPGTEAQPAADASLSDEQGKLAAKYKELERVILRMAEVMQTTDPKRAALLRKTFAQSKERRVDVQYEDLVKLLEQEQLYQASKGQFAVQQDLNQLLQLLLSGEREKQIPNERAQIKRFIERINKLIREEQGLQGETEGQGDADDLIKQQEGVAKKTSELAQDLKKFDAETNPNTSGNDSSGKDESQGIEKSDGKQGDKSGDKSPDAKKADNKDSPGKDSEGKKSDEQKSDEKKSDDPKSADKQSGIGGPEKSDSKSGGKENDEKAGKKFGFGGPADKKSDDKKSGEQPEAKNQDDKKSNDQKSNGQKSDSQKSDGQKSEDQESDGGKQSGKPAEGNPKQGKAQKGQGQQGQSEEQDDDAQQQSKSSDKQSSDNQSSARKRVQQAEDRMRTAKRQLEQAKRRGAADEQQKAVEELKQAKAELEEILRQLREEEIERVLAQLEGRFRKMLQMQLEVYEGTMGLDRIPEDERDRDTEIEAGKLSRREGEITLEADKALTLLHEEGSSVAFPESVEQMREDMAQTTARLGRTNIGQITQGIEQDIIKSLEETIAALQKAQKDQKQRRGGGGGGGGGKDQSLLDNIAELKMIRALQMRVNTRTERYSKLLQDGTERAETPDLVEAVQRLSEREQRIYKTTRDIVVGKNK
jgi:hypothetical protein